MPRPATHIFAWFTERNRYELYEQDRLVLQGDDAAWFTWLEQHTAFAFHGQHGHLNLLKEERKNRGEGYWYAYQRQGKRTIKRYAGQSSKLTTTHLETIARSLRAPAAPVRETVQAQAPLLEPKLRLPRLRASLVLRERLLERLDCGMEGKLTLLCAPAGSGKTTLVRQWLAERSAREGFPPLVAWISLDTGDNDPQRFWRYFITAGRNSGRLSVPVCEVVLSALSQSSLKPAHLETVLTLFLNALTNITGEGRGGLFVLEDYHLITETQIHRTLNFFLEHLPPSLHLIMMTRNPPPLILTRLRANGDLAEIQVGDLRFSSEEIATFLQTIVASPISEQTVRRIEERLEGWAAGLRFLALLVQRPAGQEEIVRSLAALTGTHRSILNYFVDEVFQAQSPLLQCFLLQTSFLHRLHGALCAAVTGRQESVAILEDLERVGLFLERLDGPDEWYRYHALFSEAMRQEARIRLGANEISALHQRASQWYEAQGMLAEAIEAALKVEDSERAATLIEHYIGPHLFRKMQEFHTLCRWLEQLPVVVLQGHPVLCLTYAMTRAASNAPAQPTRELIARLEEPLMWAEKCWRAEGNLSRLGELFSLRAQLAQHQGAQEQAVVLARQALIWLPPEALTWRGISLHVLGTEAFLMGQLDEARQQFLAARPFWEAEGNLHGLRSNTLVLGMISAGQGALQLAAAYYRQVLQEARVVGDREDSIPALLGMAELFYEWNRLDEAAEAAREAYESGAESEFRGQAALMRIRVLYAQGHTVLARQQLADELTHFQSHRSPELYRAMVMYQAWFLLAGGLASDALALLIRFYQKSETLSVGWMRGNEPLADLTEACRQGLPEQETLLVARLLLAEGKDEKARALLKDLLCAAREAGRGQSVLKIQLLLALAHAACKQIEIACNVLQAVLTQAQPEGYLRLFLDEGDVVVKPLRMLLPHLRGKVLANYARTVLSAFSKTAHTQTQNHAREPLSPQELRVLRLLTSELSYLQIACELTVSINTIKTQVSSIYRKLDAHDRHEASEIARQRRLL
jgi:LuxR family maltose regulon positive regulatory protein